MKRTIETNKGLYLLSKNNDYYLYATSDQNLCDKCNHFTWITHIIYKRFNKKNFINIQIGLCNTCLKNSEHHAKYHHCPFHNTHVLEDSIICETCVDKLKEKTEELYKKEIKYNNIILQETYVEM